MYLTPVPPAERRPPSPAAALHFVAELGQHAASASELRPVLDWMVERVTSMLRAEEGCLRLLPDVLAKPEVIPDSNSLQVPRADLLTVFRCMDRHITAGSWERRVADSVTRHFRIGSDLLATPDLLNDSRFKDLRGYNSRVRALLAVPLKVQKQVIGLLAVTHTRPGRRWKRQEADLLGALANESAGMIAGIWARIEAERIRDLERGLEVARLAQAAMVPASPLRAGSWEISGRVMPAQVVGGDAFDYGWFAGHLTLSILDVSGKGLQAAVLTANVQGSMRGFCSRDIPVSEKMRLLNDHVWRSTERDRFATLFYGELDPATGRLRYSNAGHNYPLLRRETGRLETLEIGGPPLGVLEGAEYEQGETTLAPGDALLVYSDGAIEAENGRREQFGEERLIRLWQEVGTAVPAECVERLMQEISAFRGRELQTDDIALVVLGSAGA